MNDKEIELYAEIIAARVSKDLKVDLRVEIDERNAQIDAHERLLRGSNGNVGLLTRIVNLERTQKLIFGVLSLIGVAVASDVVNRLLTLVHNASLIVP